MAIKTVPSATPLGIREPVLIVFAVAAVVANCTLSLVIDKWNYIEWLDAIHGGFFLGQCLVAVVLAGLMGRSWLGAFGVALGVVILCFAAIMFLEWWQVDFYYSSLPDISCVAPLALLIAAAPSMALRQLVRLRIAAESSVPWSRSGLSIGDIFIAVAFAAATLVFARVGLLSSHQDRAEFWLSLISSSLIGSGVVLLIVIPAVWCVFVCESRRAMVFGLGGLLMLPSAIILCVSAFISAETMSLEEKVQGLGYSALASLSAAVYFVPPLLLLYRRGYRLLRVPIAAADDQPARYRHASRWIVAAIVAVAAIVNFRIAPIEDSQQRKRQFEQWVSSLGGSLAEEGDETWVLDLGKGRVSDDDLKDLRNAPAIIHLDLSGTDITDAGLEYVGQLPSLRTLELNGTAVTDRGLQHLRHLPNLQSLSLANTGVTGSVFGEFESRRKIVSVDFNGAAVTDEGCRGIGELKALQELNLTDTSVTDAGLQHLGVLSRLRRLDLRYTAFHGNGFAHFNEMPDLAVVYLSASRCGDGVAELVSRAPRLAELHLDRTTVTDALMSTLQGNPTIVELELSGTAITDDGLSELQTLPNLQVLEIDGTRVTGSGFRDLSARRLEQLGLRGTRISDESLAHLKRFPRLHSIFLDDTPIGDNALAHLAGKWFDELSIASTRVTAQGLLGAHFDAYELTIDDQQANDAELAELEEIYESVIVVSRSNEVESESGQTADAGE